MTTKQKAKEETRVQSKSGENNKYREDRTPGRAARFDAAGYEFRRQMDRLAS